MNLMIERGHVEGVTTNDNALLSKKTWYIPHHVVLNPNKPDKLGIVFDCAAEYRGISVNKAVMSGSDLVNNLTAVLIRFRKGQIALAADIKAIVASPRCESKHGLLIVWTCALRVVIKWRNWRLAACGGLSLQI